MPSSGMNANITSNDWLIQSDYMDMLGIVVSIIFLKEMLNSFEMRVGQRENSVPDEELSPDLPVTG